MSVSVVCMAVLSWHSEFVWSITLTCWCIDAPTCQRQQEYSTWNIFGYKHTIMYIYIYIHIFILCSLGSFIWIGFICVPFSFKLVIQMTQVADGIGEGAWEVCPPSSLAGLSAKHTCLFAVASVEMDLIFWANACCEKLQQNVVLHTHALYCTHV